MKAREGGNEYIIFWRNSLTHDEWKWKGIQERKKLEKAKEDGYVYISTENLGNHYKWTQMEENKSKECLQKYYMYYLKDV